MFNYNTWLDSCKFIMTNNNMADKKSVQSAIDYIDWQIQMLKFLQDGYKNILLFHNHLEGFMNSDSKGPN